MKEEDKDWEQIRNIIFDIKKKREAMRKKRENWAENMMLEELSSSLAADIDKEIFRRLTSLDDEL